MKTVFLFQTTKKADTSFDMSAFAVRGGFEPPVRCSRTAV